VKHYNYVSQENIKDWLLNITREATMHDFKPSSIISPNRGGLQLGVMLSHYYDCPHFPVQVSHRDMEVVDFISIEWAFKEAKRRGPILVIDDINDSGRTINSIRDAIKHIPLLDTDSVLFAVLLEKETSQAEADFVGHYINSDREQEWVVFPWEDWWKRQILA
jgi:hypoxanthine phosphoribosyltransferase